MALAPRQLFKLLFRHYGPRRWWPAKTRFEVVVGAVLTQQTSWTSVEKAIKQLKKRKLLSPKKLASVRLPSLKPLIRCTGYYNQKAERLREVVRELEKRGGLEKFFNQPLEEARKELLSIRGIGPETADSILLYAGNNPVFVVDAYTFRLAERLPLENAPKKTKYEEMRAYFEQTFEKLPPKRRTKMFNELHALIVEHCKQVCRKKPLCRECFLKRKCKTCRPQSI